MGQITSAVDDDELIEHMREVILPFIKEVQITEELEESTQIPNTYGTPEQLITRMSVSMQAAVEGLTTQQVCKIRLLLLKVKN